MFRTHVVNISIIDYQGGDDGGEAQARQGREEGEGGWDHAFRQGGSFG